MAKIRVSNHHGRYGIARHNDRDFNVTGAEHIDNSRTKENIYWTVYDDDKKGYSFEEAERNFYYEKFFAWNYKQNERYKAKGQYKRMQTIDDWRKSSKYCPEESILQIGDKSVEVDPDIFRRACVDYINWEMDWSEAHGNPFSIVDVAIHFDETDPHAHSRRVWHYLDNNGDLRIGQDKALECAGIDLPDPSKPKSRYNNRKMSFDSMCRAKWIEICESYGFEVESEPIQGRKHKNKSDFIFAQEKETAERIANLKKQEQELSQSVQSLIRHRERLQDFEGMAANIKSSIVAGTFWDALHAQQRALDAKEQDVLRHHEALSARERKVEESEQLIALGKQYRRIQQADELANKVDRTANRPLPHIDYGY